MSIGNRRESGLRSSCYWALWISHDLIGGQDGKVRVYDLSLGEQVAEFSATSDTVNGFQFHPSLPLALTASGLSLENQIVPKQSVLYTSKSWLSNLWGKNTAFLQNRKAWWFVWLPKNWFRGTKCKRLNVIGMSAYTLMAPGKNPYHLARNVIRPELWFQTSCNWASSAIKSCLEVCFFHTIWFKATYGRRRHACIL